MVKIVVVGAGVSGLTTALELSRRDSTYKITVVAKNLPGDISVDYTSPFAGANWHSFADHDDKVMQVYDTYGYKRLMDLGENDPMSGIVLMDSYKYFTDYSVEKGDTEDPWFKKLTGLRPLSKKELPPGVSKGYKFKGLTITPTTYLHYLYLKCLSLGIVVKRVAAIEDILEALSLHSLGKADLVVNCTGLLAKHIKGYNDTKEQFGVRGQILHVRNNCSKQFSVSPHDKAQEDSHESLYIFPRKEGGCIIGGCFLRDYDHTKEDPELTQRLIKYAVKYAPELIDPSYKNNPDHIDIINVNVGQRPFRDGGVRVEIDSEHKWLIHNYGIGGSGYQSSYGLSARVCQLVRKSLKLNSKL